MVVLLRLFCVNGEYKLVVKRTNNQLVSTGDSCKQFKHIFTIYLETKKSC